MTDLSHLKADFPVLANGVHFLDSGASSQKPIPVLEAMAQWGREHEHIQANHYMNGNASSEQR